MKNGHIRRVVDDEVKSLVLEISGTNVATTYITCPIKPRASLGIKLPFLVMVIKNMKKYFTFEIQILGTYAYFHCAEILYGYFYEGWYTYNDSCR